MSETCNCLTCQTERMIRAEVERRGQKLGGAEIIALAIDLLASAMSGMSEETRTFTAKAISLALSAKLDMLDSGVSGDGWIDRREARVQ